MQIVSACLARDLPIYRLTYRSLRQHLPQAEIHVVTRKDDFPRFKSACGPELKLWDEATLVSDMTLTELRKLPFAFFPAGAGWYFQQFLKYAFVNVSNEEEYFLIWDADTILLRPIDFFDPDGKPYYTKTTEHHLPYFETFYSLFGSIPKWEYSFISQHQIISKKILREMLGEIEQRYPSARNWAWAIMQNLRGTGSNLFSEYETYGTYLAWKHPGELAARCLPWTRNGGKLAGNPPKPKQLLKLGQDYSFAAFEVSHSLRRRAVSRLRRIMGLT